MATYNSRTDAGVSLVRRPFSTYSGPVATAPAPRTSTQTMTPVYNKGVYDPTQFTASQPPTTQQSLIDAQRKANELTAERYNQPQPPVAPSMQALEAYSVTPQPRMVSSGGGGNVSVSNESSLSDEEARQREREDLELEARLKRENEIAILNKRKELNDSTFASRLAALSSPGSSGPSGSSYDPAKAEAARAVAFARAKDTAGQNARASLDTLRNVLSATGKLGSGQEGALEAALVGGTAGDINEYVREQLIQDLNYATHIDDRDFAAAQSQKDRDASYRQSMLGLINAGLY